MTYIKEVKCVIWDLDNTIWDGTLLESDQVVLRPKISDIIRELDCRGILNSIASKNNYEDAIAKLRDFALEEYFLYPEIHWNNKSESVKNIQKKLNIGIDAIVFIDDQPFERDEVSYSNPEVETIDASEYLEILNYARFNPKFITRDSTRRRIMYLEDMKRNHDETVYAGPKEEFLASLGMEFIIEEAKAEDLERAEELTVRTNQLNTTGQTYDYDELYDFMQSERHKLYVCELTDKYGSYGKIGLALIELTNTHWCINLLLMSCRVLSRSVGSILLTHIMQQARNENKKLLAKFRCTDRNKMMYVTYRFSNFKEISNDGNGNMVLEHDLNQIPAFPHYVVIKCPELTSNH